MNLHPQFYSNEDNQRTFLTCDSPVDNGIFLSSAKDTLSSCSCSSQSFLELEPLQRAKDFTSQEDITEGHRKEIPEVVDQPEILTYCAFTENMLRYFSDCLERKNQEDNKDENIPELKEREGLLSLSGEHFQKEKEPKQKGSAWYKTTFTSQNTSLCIPPHKTARPKNPQLAKGNPPRVPQHIPSKAVMGSEGGKPQKKEPICFKTTSGRLGPWKLGSWWKQALETRRASTGLLPDIEMVSSAPYAKKIPHATGRQHPHHHGIFSQSAPKQRAEKSEGRQSSLRIPSTQTTSTLFEGRNSLKLRSALQPNMPNADSIKVAVRVRPFNQREKVLQCKCIVSMLGSSTQVTDPKNLNSRKSFHFDHCYWSHDEYTENEQGVHISDGHHSRYADQAKVFNDLGRTILENVWRGFNATLFAYGQTGSGKSYTMTGYGQNKGLVSMICEELFRGIREKQSPERQFHVYFSMFEIYNEQVQDLLSKVRKPGGLRVREGRKGFYVECLKAVSCDSYEKLEALLREGIRNRSTAATNMNATSSRSHMVINLRFKQVLTKEHCLKQSEIDLVDLAGSEKQRSSGSTSDRFNEARAINLSLTTLGNVISALSDKAVGKKIHHIPYRNSTLTRLLRTALGGNSKTVMIATVSPAHINYEETLSALRYAERAKSIMNKAVINVSATERLLRDLKEENSRLQARITDIETAGAVEERETLRRLILENEIQLREIQKSWQQKLEDAKREWEQQYSTLALVTVTEEELKATLPYLVNVSEDPQLSGVLRKFIKTGITSVGRIASSEEDIVMKGLGILDKHAVLMNCDDKVTMEPQKGARILVNGVPLLTRSQLKHLDRIIFGSCVFYLYVGFPQERSEKDKIHKYGKDFFLSEIASDREFAQLHLGISDKQKENIDPNLTRVFHDFTALVPVVMQANQISQELGKNISFELEIKHLAFMDASGGELDKEVIVRVRNTNNQVWVWSKERFAECMLLMEDMYKRDSQENLQHDFFKDPVENIHLGSAQVWLESLAYCMRYEEQVDASNSQGDEEAIVHVKLLPCNADGVPLGEEAAVVDLEDLLGRRMDFQVQISQCLGVKWIKEQNSRGIQIGFQIYELPIVFYTNSSWGNINPTLAYSVHVTIQHVTMDFLNYLKTHAIILELFGLQEGCPEMETSYADIQLSNEGTVLLDMCYQDSQQSCTSTDSGNDFSELHERLLHLELECDKLREENRVLKTENFEMRGEMEERARQGPIPDTTSISEKLSNDRLSGRSAFPNFDAEFAKALKRFYFGMNGVKGKLNHLKEIRPLDEYNIRSLQYFVDERIELIKEFGGDLEGCVGKMKSDVEKIIQKKKEIHLALSAK
ncbi:kinesin-like protein KIF28 isoform X3 [Acipenser ruthenus]|uniref:kinesin-like protein KIF28 isoform X3 n=1 Tax=Acipenser ruthenus TaxID=7906 RepID=UPI0027406C5B|nr:kinesin-like protein KIF28 isoform X3 [Acipenser ruthenus]